MHERGRCSGGCLLADAFGVSAASEWRAKKFGADDECGLYAYLPNLHRLEFQSRRFQTRRSLGQVEHLDPNHLVFFVVIENHAGRDFLRLNILESS